MCVEFIPFFEVFPSATTLPAPNLNFQYQSMLVMSV